jgi:hypothetical protein
MAGYYAAAMVGSDPATGEATDAPVNSWLTTERPVGGTANAYTHALVGVTGQNKSAFQAHFTLPFSQPGTVRGDIDVLLWVSSETLKDDGVLCVDLFADGEGPTPMTRKARITIPGAQVHSFPTPIRVKFSNVQIPVEKDLTVMVATEPTLLSDGTVGRRGDAQWTLWYDSVQFPSHVTLQLPPA